MVKHFTVLDDMDDDIPFTNNDLNADMLKWYKQYKKTLEVANNKNVTNNKNVSESSAGESLDESSFECDNTSNALPDVHLAIQILQMMMPKMNIMII